MRGQYILGLSRKIKRERETEIQTEIERDIDPEREGD